MEGYSEFPEGAGGCSYVCCACWDKGEMRRRHKGHQKIRLLLLSSYYIYVSKSFSLMSVMSQDSSLVFTINRFVTLNNS